MVSVKEKLLEYYPGQKENLDKLEAKYPTLFA